jgi:hypothetical protein
LAIVLAGSLNSASVQPSSPAVQDPAVAAGDSCSTVGVETSSWSDVKQVYTPGNVERKSTPAPADDPMGACCRRNGTCFLVPERLAGTCCAPPDFFFNGNPSCTPNPCTPFKSSEMWGNVKVLRK